MKTKLIYTSPKRKTYAYIRDVSITFIFTLFILFRKKNIQSFFEDLVGKDKGETILYILISFLFLIIVFYFLSRRKKQIGIIEMSNEFLVLQLKKNTLSFNIKELINFSIKTSYFIPNEEIVGLYSSYNNWLFFEYLNKKYKYQFEIESYYKGNQFKELINFWKKNDNFTLIDEK